MKKLLLSTAVTAAIGASGAAHAVVDLDAGTGAQTYASELDFSTNTTLQDTTTGNLDTRNTLGFGVSAGATRFVRLDLSNGATFGTLPGLAVDANADGDDDPSTNAAGNVVGASQITVVEGGIGEDFVIYQFTANDGSNDISLLADTQVTVDIGDLDLTSQSSVSATYQLYETGAGASNELTSASLGDERNGTLLTFGSALNINADPSTTNPAELIDVTEESLLFTDNEDPSGDNTVSGFGTASIALVSPAPLRRDSSAVTQLDEIIDVTNSGATIAGDFTSASSVSNDNGTTQVGTIAGDGQSVTFAGTDLNNAVSGDFAANPPVVYEFLYTTDGSSTIQEGDFELTLNLAANPGYILPNSIGPVSLDSFSKNGSTAELNMALDPDGAFRNFIRITNPTTVQGRVFVTLINDQGDREQVNLDEIFVNDTDQQPAQLSANSATRLIPIEDILNAIQANNDPNFGVVSGPRNKFRVIVEGEFSEVRLDNVTLATDNSTFSTF